MLLYVIAVLNSAMKPAAPPALCTAQLLDQSCECIRSKHYSLRTELDYAMARLSPDGGFVALL